MQPTIWAERSRLSCGNHVLYGHLDTAPKYTELTVERHYTRLLRAPRHWERVRCPSVIEAEAVAAMTCPGAVQLKTARMSTGVTI